MLNLKWSVDNVNKIILDRYVVLTWVIVIGAAIFYADINRRISAVTNPQNQPQQSCNNLPSSRSFVRTELFFGLSKPDRAQVTEREFQQFINREVTPRFPEGLTLLSGSGQFKTSSNTIVKEPANLLILIYPQDRSAPGKFNQNQKVEQIRKAYKLAFKQESVLRSDELSCVSF
jgi:Protein of unknown function (DUF3574)